MRNYGIGGTRIARQNAADEFEKRGNFCDRMRNMEDSDVMVVFGGTNDFGHGDAPMGEFSDRDDRTFYGACPHMFFISCGKIRRQARFYHNSSTQRGRV